MHASEDGADWRARALIVADGEAGTYAAEAVAASSLRLLGAVGWAEALARFDRQGTVDVVLAEAGGVADGMLDRVLPRLATLAAGGDTRIVVALNLEQIDLVAAEMAGPGVDLLCSPTIAERIGALVLATATASATDLQDVARDADAAQLRRLNEEVARIAETLARLTRGNVPDQRFDARDDGYRTVVGDRTLGYSVGPRVEIAPREVRDAIRARRMRDQLFGSGLFEDPAWDMLLDLFAAELERAQVSVSSLCIAAAVAPTTALRWIARMTEAGLFERRPDPFDRRRAFMALSDRASTGMHDYVATLRRAGLALG